MTHSLPLPIALAMTLPLLWGLGCGTDSASPPPPSTDSADSADTSAPRSDADTTPPSTDVDVVGGDGERSDISPPPPSHALPQQDVALSGQATPESLLVAQDLTITQFSALSLGRALVANTEGLWEYDELLADPIAYGDAAGTVTAMVVMEPDTALVFGTQGIYVAGYGELKPSPLNDLLSGVTAATRQAGSPWRIWISNTDTLYTWADEQLEAIEIGGLTPFSAPPLLAATAHPPTGWLATDQTLTAVTWEGNVLSARTELTDLEAQGITVTGEDQLWILEAGRVLHRSPESTWTELHFPSLITALVGHADFPALWLRDEMGWMRYEGTLYALPGLAAEALVTSVDNDRILAAHGTELHRITAGVATGPAVTWSEHIEPLYQQHCAAGCHANPPYRLDLPACWHAPETEAACNYDPSKDEQGVGGAQSRWERIRVYVESGFMPIGGDPLSASELQQLYDWANGGFVD